MNFGFSVSVPAWNVIGSAWRAWRYLLKHGLLVLLGLLVAQPWVYGETVRFDAEVKLVWDEYRKVSVNMNSWESHVLTTGICGERLTRRTNIPMVPFEQELDLNADGNCPNGRSWFLDEGGNLFVNNKGKNVDFTPNGRLQRHTINYTGRLTIYAENYRASCPSFPCLTTASVDFFEATPYKRNNTSTSNHTFSINAGQSLQKIREIPVRTMPENHKAWPTSCSANSSNSRVRFSCEPSADGKYFILKAAAADASRNNQTEIIAKADVKLVWDEYRKVSVNMNSWESHVLTTGICGERLTRRTNIPVVPFEQELDLNADGNCPNGRSWFLDEGGNLFVDNKGKNVDFTPNGRLQRHTINYTGRLTIYAENYRASCPSFPCLTTASVDFFEATPYKRNNTSISNHTFSINAGQSLQKIREIPVRTMPENHKAWPTSCSANSSNSRVRFSCQPSRDGKYYILKAAATASPPPPDDDKPKDDEPPKDPSTEIIVENEEPRNGKTVKLGTVDLEWEVSEDNHKPLTVTQQVYLNGRKAKGDGCYHRKVTINRGGKTFRCEVNIDEYDEDYDWYVKVTDTATGKSVTGDEWIFLTAKNQAPEFDDFSPKCNTQNLDPAGITLKWDADDPEGQDLEYEVELHEVTETRTKRYRVCRNTRKTQCELPPGLVKEGTLYYWEVTAEDEAGEETTSESCYFRTRGNKPPEVTRLSPCERTGQAIDNVTLSWRATDSEREDMTYTVFLSENILNSGRAICNSIRSTSCRIPAPLNHNSTYLWHVEATDESGKVGKSDICSFKTIGNNAPTVSNLNPCRVTDQAIDNLVLNWNARDPEGDNLQYTVNFTEGIAGARTTLCDNLVTTSCALPGPLEHGTSYFWQVEAKDSANNVGKSDYCGFTTLGNTAPNKASNPTLDNGGTPIANAATDLVDRNLPLTFGWQGNGDPEGDAVSYRACYVSLKKIALADITPETNLTCVTPNYTDATSVTLAAEELEYDTPYAWMVSVKDENDNKSEWDIWNFTTQPAPVRLLLKASSGYSTTRLDWNINNDANVKHYRVWRKKDGEDYTEVTCDDCEPPSTSFEDSDALEQGAKYCYKLEALDLDDKVLYQSKEDPDVTCVTQGKTLLAMTNDGGLNGQDVSVPVTLRNGGNLRITSSDIWLRYDPAIITHVNSQPSTLLNGKNYSVSSTVQADLDDNSLSVVRISIQSNDLVPQPIVSSGALVELTFTVVGNAGEQSELTLIPLRGVNNGSSIQDENGNDILLGFIDGNLEVKLKKGLRAGGTSVQFFVSEAYIKGDLNGNGIVQTADARNARFIGVKALEATDEQQVAGDTNEDTYVDSGDAGMIVHRTLNDEWPNQPNPGLRSGVRNGQTTPIRFSLGEITASNGAQATTTLNVSNIVASNALNLAIVYDTQVIADIVSVARAGLTNNAQLVYHDDGNGILRIGVDSQTPIEGSGAFANITVKLASNNSVRSTRLLIAETRVYDNLGRDFTSFGLRPIEAEHGTVTNTDVDAEIEPPPEEVEAKQVQLADLLPDSVSTPVYAASGQIRDQDGTPMAGVTVTLNAQTTTTDEYGYWAILGLTEGEYPVSVSQDGYTFNATPCVIAEQQNCRLTFTGRKNAQPATCRLYAVNDEALNDSQFLTIDLDSHAVTPLGPTYTGHDIEALAVHPTTDEVYAASGNDTNVFAENGFLYKLDTESGELIKIGATGFEEIGDLAFDANGVLWGWAKGQGLIVLDVTTGVGTLIMPSQELLEGLTFAKDQGTVLYGGVSRRLVKYDFATGTLDNACLPDLGQMEALEMMADGVLLIGIHEEGELNLHALDPAACAVVDAVEIPIQPYSDVEGIALPIAACRRE